MDVLVTGAAGFIGSHLVEKLLSRGDQVVGIDNFDPIYARKLKEANLINAKTDENFKFIEMNIGSDDLDYLFSKHDFDHIIHLAAKAGVRTSFDHPKSNIHHDIEGMVNILECARAYGTSNIIFGSSSSVYGNNRDFPLSENDKMYEPISPYAATKLSCEMFNHVYASQYGMNITNLRFFTVYGPRQRPDMAIHKFVRSIDRGKSIEIYGKGGTSRDYTYVDDIIDGIILAMNIRGYNTYNLGNNEAIPIRNLIDTIMEIMGKEVDIIYQPMQLGDVYHTIADISKAREELQYNPKTSITEGIQKFLNWYYDSEIII